MKKVLIKVLVGVLAALLVGVCIFIAVKKPFRKITGNELAIMLTETLDIDTETPFDTLKEMGYVDAIITKNGDEKLTNEEACSIISRMYLLNQNDATSINYISDSSKISKEFKYDIAGLVGDSYIEKGKFKPKSLAKYQNVSNIIEKIKGTEITESGECYDKITSGNFTIKQSGVTLTHAVFGDSIIVADTDNASITLSGVVLRGKLIVRAASGTKVVLKDNTQIGRGIFIVGAGGNVVIESDGTTATKIFTNASSDITGTFTEITLLEGADVNYSGQIETVKVKESSKFNITEGSFSLIYSQSKESEITVGSSVTGTQIALSPESQGNKVTFAGKAEDISIEAKDSLVNIKGTSSVTKLNIYAGSDNSTVLIEKGTKTGSINNAEGSNAVLIDNRSQWDGRR